MDVQPNPGPKSVPESEGRITIPSSTQLSDVITYTRRNLLELRKHQSSRTKPSIPVIETTKSLKLYRYRGSRGGCNRHGNRHGNSATDRSERTESIPVIIGVKRLSKNVCDRGVVSGNLFRVARKVNAPLPDNTPSNSVFAVPKFSFTNICSLAKTKNRVRAVVALEVDLNNEDIDICVVSETHLKPSMPYAIVNISGYSIL